MDKRKETTGPLREGRVSGYVGEDMKHRVNQLVGYLGFTSESHFVQYAVEEAVEKAEKEVAGIKKVYHVLRKETYAKRR